MDPARVLEIYADHLSQTVLSADSPRYWAFIPAAPTKAALLFDMVVSAASLQGISWLEAAGAVAAENQALRWISDAAGLPATAGGAFVSGGSAGNLSALVVARDTARRRLVERDGEPARYRRLRVAVSDQAHSSIKNTLSIIDVDPLVVTHGRPPLHRRGAARRPRRRRRPATSVVAVVATSGTTNAGIIDDLRGDRRRSRASAGCGSTSTAPTAAPACSRRACATGTPASSSPTRSSSTRTSGCSRRTTAPRCSTASRGWPRPCTPRTRRYLDAIHHDDGSYEWNPTDYAYHLTRRARGLPLWFSLVVNGTDAYTEAIEHSIALARRTAGEIDAGRAPRAAARADPRRSCCSGAPAGAAADYDALGRAAARTTRSPSSRARRGRARRSAGSPSCTRAPRSTWCARSSPRRPDPRRRIPDRGCVVAVGAA